MAMTNAQKQRAMRQDSLREFASKKCTLQQVVATIEKIEELDPYDDGFTNSLAKYRTANDQRLKVIDKYLPTVKQTELMGEGGGPVEVKAWTLTGVEPDAVD